MTDPFLSDENETAAAFVQKEHNSFKSASLMLSSMLRQIALERERHATCVFISQSEEIELVSVPRWPIIFQQAFLTNTNNKNEDCTANGPRDDLLFFVFKRKPNSRSKITLKVFRLNSSKLPEFNDPLIDWQETVYLNLLMQYLVYTVTVAVCTRTGPQELQILKKFSETVYASPNRRQMDGKSQADEVVYPNLFFSVDNYDEVFSNCVVHDSECICVELTAYDLSGQMRGVCFLGTIQYDSLKKCYDAKSTPVQRTDGFGLLGRQFGSMSNRGTLCALNSSTGPQAQPIVKFMRMQGPQAKGLAEFAVRAVDTADHGLGFCRCGEHRAGLLDPVCCSCVSPSPQMLDDPTDGADLHTLDRTRVEFQIGSPVTRQPTKFTSGLNDWSDLPDSTDTQFLPKSGPGVAKRTVPDIQTLHSIPASAKSAGASAETSPVHRWPRRFRDVSPSGSMHETAGGSVDHLRQMFTNGGMRTGQPRRGSKVSEILERFTRIGTTDSVDRTKSGSANTVDITAATTGFTNPLNEDGRKQAKRLTRASQFGSINEENDDADDGFLYTSRDGHQRSFGQAWSWFKERRRLTSVGLNVSLTFLSIPSDGILTDLLESKREPILNIAD